jgi:hypothetical protein
MKKLSVLIVVAILGIVLWALPAGAEKIRLTDAELDGITAGFALMIPPPTSLQCCVDLVAIGFGGMTVGPPISIVAGNLTLGLSLWNPALFVNVSAAGTTQNPPPSAVGSVLGSVSMPGLAVPFHFTFP